MGQEDKYSNLLAIPPSVAGRTVTTTTTTSTTTTTRALSPIEPFGSLWYGNANLSNAHNSRLASALAGANDFNLFNPYIHYAKPAGGTVALINTNSLLELSRYRFEIYSREFRGAGAIDVTIGSGASRYTTTGRPTTTTTKCPQCDMTILVGINRPYAVHCLSCEGTVLRFIEYT